MKLRTGNRGFTLIEVLIALSVLGVTMAAIFTGFASGLKLRSVTRERMAFDREARVLINTLRDDLANLVPAGPAPMVSDEAIVLWRRNTNVAVGMKQEAAPLIVTYQWSGSSTQDSLLVRVAAPLTIDAADFGLVHQEFMRWARLPQMAGATTSDLLREDDGPRFGSQATLDGLSGAWVAYPRIRQFSCQITGTDTEGGQAPDRSRIQIRISAADRATCGADIEAGFWLPLVARLPSPLEDELSTEVLP